MSIKPLLLNRPLQAVFLANPTEKQYFAKFLRKIRPWSNSEAKKFKKSAKRRLSQPLSYYIMETPLT